MPSCSGPRPSFLNDAEVVSFADWLADVICGIVPIDHVITDGARFNTLSSARAAYQWPPKTIVLSMPTGAETLPRRSGLPENEAILRRLAAGLRGALKENPRNDDALAEWIKAIFVWGGVYTKNGNGAWLEAMRGSLGPYLDRTLATLESAQEEQDIDRLTDLRSNAGMTKVHSLALDEFIMYDSRVAAALAWLVVRWACSTNRNSIPAKLRFGCMKPNTTDQHKTRTPDTRLFPYFAPVSGNLSSQRTHALWNLRATWLLRAALERANEKCEANCNFHALRDVEAGLFVMGADLSCMIPSLRACIDKLAVDPAPKGKISRWSIEELRPIASNAITQEDVVRELDKRMHGDHRFWNPPGKKR